MADLHPLRQIRILEHLTQEEIAFLDKNKQCKVYKKSELVFKENSFPKALFCVFEGKVKVFQSGHDGKEQIVHLIGKGDIMGHRALCGGDRFSCSGVAMEDSRICLIPREVFMQLIHVSPKLSFRIAELLADELKEAEMKITHMAQSSVRSRLASVLLGLIDSFGYKADQKTLNVHLSREDLATLAGTTRETVTRMLKDLTTLGAIQIQGKNIQIIQPELLRTAFH